MTLQVVVGGQYGSEGKGAIAAHLSASHADSSISIRVAGPNAGHTVIGRCPPGCSDIARASTPPERTYEVHTLDQHPWRLRQVPVAAVSNPTSVLAIAAGSEIDTEVLLDEIVSLDAAGYNVSSRLLVDSQATLLTFQHRALELRTGLTDKLGSTGKGIGAARAARVMREATLARDISGLSGNTVQNKFDIVLSVAAHAARLLRDGGDVLIEGTQGYHLGTHAGYYPKCTSSDCTAIDFLSMAGLSPWLVPANEFEVWVVFRTYPIRVAGNSGPLANETTWEALGLPPELTTVTRKVRRVGTWNAAANRAAMAGNGWQPNIAGPVHTALTMADQVIPELAGYTDLHELWADKPEIGEALDRLLADRSKDLGDLIDLIGTGPASILDLRNIA